MNIVREVKSAPQDIGMNAMLYCVTMMEKAELPHRGFYYDKMVETMDAASVALARAVLADIEATEGVTLAQLKPGAIEHYTLLFARIYWEIYDSCEHAGDEEAAQLLEEMRAGSSRSRHSGREVWRSAS